MKLILFNGMLNPTSKLYFNGASTPLGLNGLYFELIYHDDMI